MLNSMGLGFVFRASDETQGPMRSVQNNLAKTREVTAAAQKSMEHFGDALTKVSIASAAAGAAIVAGFGLATNEATKFGRSVSEVMSIADRAQFPMAEIERIGKDMAATYGGDVNQQVKALYQAISSGASTASESVALLHAANQLAIGGVSDSTKAVDALTNVLNAYGLKMDQAASVSDAMFTTVRVGKTTVDELATVIGRVAPLAQAAGVRMDEMFAAITAASTKLGNATESVTGLKAVLAGIMKPTTDAAAEAARLGISFDSTALRSKGFVQFLRDITENSKFSATTMEKLFGSVEAINVVSALAANNGSSFAASLDAMAKKSGATAAAFETVAADAKFAGDLLKTNLQIALIEIGQAVMPAVSAVVRFVTEVVKGFQRLPDPVKRGLVIFTAVAGGVLLAAGAVGGLVAALLASEIPLIMFAAAVGGMVSAFAPVIVGGLAVAAAVYGIKRAFDQNIGGLRDTVVPIFEKIQLAWRALSQAFTQGGFSGAVRDELNRAENQGIKNFAINVYAWVSRISNFFEGLKKGFAAASDAAGPVFARFSVALDRLVAVFGRLFGSKESPEAAAAMFDKFGSAGERVGGVIERVAEVIVSGLTYAMEWSSSFIETIREYEPSLLRAWEAIKSVGSALRPLGEALGFAAGALMGSGDSADSSAAKFAGFVATLANVVAVGARVASFLIRALAGAFYVVGGVVTAVRAIIESTLKALISGITTVLGLVATVQDKIAGLFGVKGNNAGLLGSLGAKGLDGKRLGGGGPAAASAAAGAAWGAPGGATPFGAPAAAEAAGGAVLAPMTTPTIPIAAAAPLGVPSATPSASGSPAAASARAMAPAPGEGPAPGASPAELADALSQALRAQPAPQAGPVVAPIYLDGEKIGEAMANRNGTNAARSFQPAPGPTG